MTQPPYGEPEQQPPAADVPGPYPPPADPFHTTAQPASPPQGYPPAGYESPAMSPSPPGYPSPYSPPAGQAPSYPYPPPADWTSSFPQPAYPATYPGAGEAYGPPPGEAYAPKRSRSLMITLIVLGIAVVLCGGGGTGAYLFLRNASDGQGAESPQVAVNDFLVAVYTEHDADKAGQLVCSDARDKAQLTKKIDEVRAYAEKYKDPKFSWPEPTVADVKEKSAKVSVTVRITTEDEKVAEQPLNFTVIEKTGWFVCEIQAGS